MNKQARHIKGEEAVTGEYQIMQNHPNFKTARANARVAIRHFELIVGEMRLLKEKYELEDWLAARKRKADKKVKRHQWKAKYIFRPWQKVEKFFKFKWLKWQRKPKGPKKAISQKGVPEGKVRLETGEIIDKKVVQMSAHAEANISMNTGKGKRPPQK